MRQHTDTGYKQTEIRYVLPEDPAHLCAHQGRKLRITPSVSVKAKKKNLYSRCKHGIYERFRDSCAKAAFVLCHLTIPKPMC